MSKKDTLVVALDMGTSSVRAMAFDWRGRELPGWEVQLPYAQRTTADGGVETDAETLLEQTVECLRRLLRVLPKTAKTNLAGVGVSCFWHSLIGVGPDNRAVTPVYSWADTRAKEQADRLRRECDPDDYHQRTGAFLHTSYWPAKLLWLSESHADLFAQATRWMSFGEYVTLRLFGEARCTVSMACGTGLFNPNLCDWDEAILAKMPLGKDHFNALCDRQDSQSGLLKEWRRGLQPLQSLPWFPAVGDGACSNLGSGAGTNGRIALNVGTSAAMRVVIKAEKADIPAGLFCYRVDRERFLVGGAFASGGNVHAWLQGTLQTNPRSTYAIAARRMGTMKPDAHGLTVLPFWAGERSPGWHVGARATILGMNLHTNPLDIQRASLEAVAYQFAVVLERLRGTTGDTAPAIIASGGALVHDAVWTQIITDVFGLPVTASKVAEASSRGAALIALNGLGLLKDLDDAPTYAGKTFAPNSAAHAVYEIARARQDALYQMLIVHP